MTDSWITGRFMTEDEDVEETKMRCTECGSVTTKRKPGIKGKSYMSCRDCREDTVHKPED